MDYQVLSGYRAYTGTFLLSESARGIGTTMGVIFDSAVTLTAGLAAAAVSTILTF